RGHVRERGGQAAQRRREVLALTGQLLAHGRQLVVEPPYLLVALGQHGRELLQVRDRAEEVLPAVGERGSRLRQVVQGVAQVAAVAGEVGAAGGDEVGERAVGVGATRPQRLVEVVQRAVHVVEFQRRDGSGQRQVRPVREFRAAVVRRGQLHVPVAHDARWYDDG